MWTRSQKGICTVLLDKSLLISSSDIGTMITRYVVGIAFSLRGVTVHCGW